MHYLLLFFTLFLFLGHVGFSDEIRPASLQIRALDSQNYDVTWKVPAKKDAERLALYVRFDKNIKRLHKPIGVYISGYYVQNWRIYANEGLAKTHLYIDGLSSSSSEVLLRHITQDAEVISSRLTPSLPQYTFKEKAGKLDTIKTYIKLGIEHILQGIDHLLFVACLVLIASTFSKLLWIITGFTVAHSITLFLSAMNWVQVPIPPIEALIALSIVFLAVEIAKENKKSLTYRYPLLISSTFGLLHGFGFASALKEIGLPHNERVTALLFFNVGVEIGQLIFVSLLLVIIGLVYKIWKRSTGIMWSKYVSYVIGSVAMMWLFQRLVAF